VEEPLKVKNTFSSSTKVKNISTPPPKVKTISTSTPPTPTPPPEIQVFVNDKEIKVPVGSVIIQACAAAGIDIPRFCYHERLGIAGNCRMCLVQVEKMPKLLASCSQPVAPGMRIRTDSPQVKKAREGVMEFLLANHPLDCAICDQGGECDLQDQAMAFGSDRSRFNLETERKRAVENKDFGPLIKTSMNRCIHCTRCVRFANEIAGLPELGTTGRGNEMQIGTYVHEMLGSELSSNIIDLCPVGALTSKPYEFAARPWELRKTESIDVLDAVGSAISIDTRGIDLMRIQPRTHDEVNEEWISDKSRFVFDALKTQRLDQPAIDGAPCNWNSALSAAAASIRQGKVAVVAGPFADAETLVCARDLMAKQGALSHLFIAPSLYDSINPSPCALPCEHASQFTSGLALQQLEQIDALLLIGANMRHEAPLLNARLRKAFLKNDSFSAAVIGCQPDDQLNFDFDWLGADLNSLNRIDKSPFWAKLCNASNPALLLSTSLIYEHPAGPEILAKITNIAKSLSQANPNFIRPNWNGLAWVPRSASHVAARLIGYSNAASKSSLAQYETLILIGSPDSISSSLANQKTIYLGHHADRLAPTANIILPCAAYTEKSATFVNLEGRVQRTEPALNPPGDARPDWSILRALSEFIDPSNPLPYNSLEELRSLRFPQVAPNLIIHLDQISPFSSDIAKSLLSLPNQSNSSSPTMDIHKNIPFTSINIPDFYLTDPISRSSATMAKCSLAFTTKSASNSTEIDQQFDKISLEQ
jgi:NADH dehydrogenase (ubiquinone) Fe-S protein 1